MKIFGQSTSTRAALAPRFAGIALGLLSVLTGSRWLMLLACACAGALIAALILRPTLDGIELTTTMPARTTVGADVECQIVVANAGTRWSPQMPAVHAVELLEVKSTKASLRRPMKA